MSRFSSLTTAGRAVGFCVAILAALLVPQENCESSAHSPEILPWAALLDRAQGDPLLESARAKLLVRAKELAQLPTIRRAHQLSEVGQNRTWLDGRSKALEAEIRELFALAMSDYGAANTLAEELPILAAAYRLSGEDLYRERVLEQLEEMTTWTPLQRPGWTLYSPGNRLPADGRDGNWLATGCGVRAIGNTLDLLTPETVPEDLRTRLFALLEKEIEGVAEDWRIERPWFVRSDDPITNQWVLPTEGLVRACLITGREGHREAYELGVANLLKALNAHGSKGEFEEGFGYASFTMNSLFQTAHAMAVAGDRRALDHPFLKNFPTWLVHHFQPGGFVINCFDAGPAYDAARKTAPLLSLIAVCTGDPVARWALRFQIGGPSEDLPGLGASALPPIEMTDAPSLFAVYDRAARVNWRDSWDPQASGVWIRGGHPLDQHDHQDRGHINFISRGRPLLIEAGTPSYDHPLMMTHYSSGAGHNVLQIGTAFPDFQAEAGKLVRFPGWQKEHGVAPISVKRLDLQGGEVQVDGTACYEGLARWNRTISWTANLLEVTDEVELAAGQQPEVLLFRWHLGTSAQAAITDATGSYRVNWSDAELTLTSSEPLAISQVSMPDNTLAGHTGNQDPKNTHTCVAVQSRAPLRRLAITTRIHPQ